MGDESHNSQVDDDESVDKLFREIWERESQPELRFQVPGVGEVSFGISRLLHSFDVDR